MATSTGSGSPSLDTINNLFGTALEFPKCFRKPGTASLFSSVHGSAPDGGLMPASLSTNPNPLSGGISFHATGIQNSLGFWTHTGSLTVAGECIVTGTEFRSFVTHNVLDGISNEITAVKENTISAKKVMITGSEIKIDAPRIDLKSSFVGGGNLDGRWTYNNFEISQEPDAVSDIFLKKDIQPLEGSLEKILKLQGVSFSWQEDKAPYYAKIRSREVGLIAQQVEEIVPEVLGTKIVLDENNNKIESKSIKYGNLVALLIEAIKEQQEQINELKTIVNNKK